MDLLRDDVKLQSKNSERLSTRKRQNEPGRERSKLFKRSAAFVSSMWWISKL